MATEIEIAQLAKKGLGDRKVIESPSSYVTYQNGFFYCCFLGLALVGKYGYKAPTVLLETYQKDGHDSFSILLGIKTEDVNTMSSLHGKVLAKELIRRLEEGEYKFSV